jgi:hypothetical protein
MFFFEKVNKDLGFEEYITSEIDRDESHKIKVISDAIDRFIEKNRLERYEIQEDDDIYHLRIKCTLLRRAKRYLDDEHYTEILDQLLDLYRKLLNSKEDLSDMKQRWENRDKKLLKDISPTHPDIIKAESERVELDEILRKLRSGKITPHEAKAMLDNVELKLDELAKNAE